MAEIVKYLIGDRVLLKPSSAELAMEGTVIAVWPARSRLGPEYDVKVDKGPYVDDIWRGWHAAHLTHIDPPPEGATREELEQWLAC